MNPNPTSQPRSRPRPPLYGMRFDLPPPTPLKRSLPTEESSSTGQSAANEERDIQNVADERRKLMLKELYARSERLLDDLFSKDVDSFRKSRETAGTSEQSSDENHATAQSSSQTKTPARVIDEDNYDDEDDEDEDSGDKEAEDSPLRHKATTSDVRAMPQDVHLSPNMKFTSALTNGLPSFARQSTASSADHNRSSEEIRKDLEKEKKAEEDRAKDSFVRMFYTLENDRDAMLEQQKLDELDRQVETEMSGQNGDGSIERGSSDQKQGTLSSANLGASSLTLKHLIARIDANRSRVMASDTDLRKLMSEVRKNRSKWANEDKIGQEELYEAAERVLMELKGMTEYSQPFLQRVNKREAPDYYRIIHEPMDIGTMIKKLKQLMYKSKKEFVRDLDLIWTNCLTYNADKNAHLRKKAEHMKKACARLTPLIPDIVIRDRAEVEAEERRNGGAPDEEDSDDDEPIVATRGRKAPAKKSTKGASSSRKAAPAPDTGSPAPELPARQQISEQQNWPARGEHLRSDGELVDGGLSTPPPGGSSTPTQLGASSLFAAGGSQADATELESNTNAPPEDQLEDEDEDYKTWRQVTKKDRAQAAARRHRLFKGDKLNPEEPALLRTRASMRRFIKQQRRIQQQYQEKDDSGEPGQTGKAEQNRPVGDDGATLAEDMDVDDENTLPDYYDPQSNIPKIPDILQWTLDSEGNVINHREACLREYPRGQFIAPVSQLADRINGNNRQIQDTRKIAAKIAIVKQMQVQSQTYQNQFQKYEIQPFEEQDIEPVVVSDDGPLIAPVVVREALKRSIGKLFFHAGFEEYQAHALEVVTDIAATYFHKLGRTLKLYMEHPQVIDEAPQTGKSAAGGKQIRPRFSPEEQILHALNECGTDLNDMASYVDDDVGRLSSKLTVHHERMKEYLAELLRPAMDPNYAGVDSSGAFNDGNEAQFVAGDFAEETGDDFFGFKELGLDKELGISNISVPLHLLQSRMFSVYQPQQAPTNANVGLLMEYPPAYPALTSENVSDQIGLMQQFFQEKLDKVDDGVLVEDEDLPAKQRFPKPRLPPNGKISSPRKRPIREQQMMARKKRRMELEAEREKERERERELDNRPNGDLTSTANSKAGASNSQTPVAKTQALSNQSTNNIGQDSSQSEAQLPNGISHDAEGTNPLTDPVATHDFASGQSAKNGPRLDPPSRQANNIDPEKKKKAEAMKGKAGAASNGSEDKSDHEEEGPERGGMLSPESLVVAAH